MRKGFVFGKFLPFHKGHEAMIQFAASRSDLLTVLVCCGNREPVPASVRKAWLANTFRDHPNVEIQVFEYDEDLLPNTSVTSSEVSSLWAAEFKTLFPDYTHVVTSEAYGELVAGFMGIEHIPFDPGRQQYPVSGTQIRKDRTANWLYLPDSVKEDYITKVVILGTESTGKTTLTNRLAVHFNCSSVMEAARGLIEDSSHFTMDDLCLVAERHAGDIAVASKGNSPLLIIDTDIHITLSYAVYAFGRLPAIKPKVFRRNAADLYLYLNNDTPYVQDGSRLSKRERNLLDASHRKTLQDYHIRFEEISGDWEERMEKAVACIDRLLAINIPPA